MALGKTFRNTEWILLDLRNQMSEVEYLWFEVYVIVIIFVASVLVYCDS